MREDNNYSYKAKSYSYIYRIGIILKIKIEDIFYWEFVSKYHCMIELDVNTTCILNRWSGTKYTDQIIDTGSLFTIDITVIDNLIKALII